MEIRLPHQLSFQHPQTRCAPSSRDADDGAERLYSRLQQPTSSFPTGVGQTTLSGSRFRASSATKSMANATCRWVTANPRLGR